MRRRLKTICALALSSSLFSGCGNLYKTLVCGNDKDARALYDNGYDPIHVYFCGPKSLHDLFSNFGECVDKEDISKEILRHRGYSCHIGMAIAMMFNAEAMDITFPDEIREVLRRHGYDFNIITGNRIEMLDYLNKMCLLKEKGIVRLKAPKGLSQHWEKFPTEHLFSTFGDKSIIVEIYNVRK